ncbi:MAG TPA: hypothetical protein VJ692_12655 [Nitrospiraceae bacterium]|nr:hypothetical protein [Nitrospiraceae bacterium]
MSLRLFVLLTILTAGVLAQADEPTEVSVVVAAPDAYHLRTVMLQGIVGQVRLLDPYFLPSGTACYGAYTFALEDTNGSGDFIEVAVLGVCGRPIVLYPEVAEGDRILVQAEIQIPSRFGQSRGLDGRPLPTGEQPPVRAIAKTITRLGE